MRSGGPDYSGEVLTGTCGRQIPIRREFSKSLTAKVPADTIEYLESFENPGIKSARLLQAPSAWLTDRHCCLIRINFGTPCATKRKERPPKTQAAHTYPNGANHMNQPKLTTIALTFLRVIIGIIFAAHGFQKFNEYTIPGTQAAFAQLGVPAAQLAAPAVATLEVMGGIALVAGVLARLFAALLALNMLGALFFVHVRSGFFVDQGGFEFVLALTATSLAIALTGAGRLSVDAVLLRGRKSKLSVLA